MLRKLFLLICMLSALNGCTRDDLCDEATATTPLLIIRFMDSSNPQLTKPVQHLTVELANASATEVVSRVTTDSIAIPLSTFENLTNYRFIQNDNNTNPNADIVQFTYTLEDIYVNRACAFKSVFRELTVSVQNEGTANWIVNTVILNPTIEDETTAHLTILH